MRILTVKEELILRLIETTPNKVVFSESETMFLQDMASCKRIFMVIHSDTPDYSEGEVEVTELGKLALKVLPALRGFT